MMKWPPMHSLLWLTSAFHFSAAKQSPRTIDKDGFHSFHFCISILLAVLIICCYFSRTFYIRSFSNHNNPISPPIYYRRINILSFKLCRKLCCNIWPKIFFQNLVCASFLWILCLQRRKPLIIYYLFKYLSS